jgi:PAS domain S-box-containing protein
MSGVDASTQHGPQRLGMLIRERREEIIARWERGARTLPHARQLEHPRLVDHVPELLDRIAWLTEQEGQEPRAELGEHTSTQHAIARLEEGFDLDEVIDEFGVLREVVCDAMRASGKEFGLDDLCVLHRAIHTAVKSSVERYTDVRERTLQGFDRIGAAALESRSLDDLLRRLLQVLHETTPSIDMSSIYLREGDVFRVRAAVGSGREAELGLEVRQGEGFAGRVAERRLPMTLHQPDPDEFRSPLLAAARMRVVHGVPILDDATVIGVAKIASSTADDFSLQDRRIFEAMVARASAAILQHVLREQAQRTAEQLAEREADLRALADNIPQLAWMADAHGVVHWFNAGWYEYTGLSPEDMKGAWKPKVHHPEHSERVKRFWESSIAAGAPWEDLLALRGKDGHFRWFLSRAVPIRDAAGNIERWFGTNTDVTARRFLDNATMLLSSALDYRQTLPQLARLVVPDLADACVVDLIVGNAVEHVAEVPEGCASAFERDLTAPEATRIDAPLETRGQTFGVLHLVMNEAGRRFRPAEIEAAIELGRRAGVAIDNARLYRNAQDAVRVRDDVLAIVSHDLRNPLNAVGLSATSLLKLHGSDARARKHIEIIRRAADRMEHLIDDLLDMASINVGHFSIEPARLDACDVIDEALDIHEPLAGERGIKIVRACDVSGVALEADRGRLLQVFGNLLGNALKFCSPGDVVTVRGIREGDRIHVSIADTGPGIPGAELPHIFEPYWSGGRKKKGAGLGLFITKAIVEAHAGAISVVSEEGRGATFEVTLPIAA